MEAGLGAGREGEDSVGGNISGWRCHRIGRTCGRPAVQVMPRTLRRRGWLMRRLLLLADLVGSLHRVRPRSRPRLAQSGGRHRRQPLGGRALRREPAALGAPCTHARPLRPGRGANRPLVGRRHLRGPPGGLDRHVGLRRRSPRSSASRTRTSRAWWSSGGSPSCWFRCCARSRRALGRRKRRVHPERHRRRLRSASRTCSPTRSTNHPEYGLQGRRLRRSRRRVARTANGQSSCSGRPPTCPSSCASTRCTESRSRSPPIRTSRRSR